MKKPTKAAPKAKAVKTKAAPKAKEEEVFVTDDLGFVLLNDPEFDYERDSQLSRQERIDKIHACVNKYDEYGIHRISNDYVGKMRATL